MRGDVATPLAALRRNARGARGQPPGAITTDPKEVDEIIRETYGGIFAGNVKEGKMKKMVGDYMGKYKNHIYKRQRGRNGRHHNRGSPRIHKHAGRNGGRHGPVDTGGHDALAHYSV